MAKFRPVPSLSPEEFLGGAANASAVEGVASLALVTQTPQSVDASTSPASSTRTSASAPSPASSTPSASSPSVEADASSEDELVSITIRIKRRHYVRLMSRAATEERSLAQVARRLLEPVIES